MSRGSGSGEDSQGEMVWRIVGESAKSNWTKAGCTGRRRNPAAASEQRPAGRRAREEMQLQLVIGEEEDLLPPLDPRSYGAEQKKGQQRLASLFTKTQPCPSQ